jgi:YVTN family beta-propeller protein
LFVANRRGSVSVIDTSSLRLTAEVPVGKRLADLALAPGGEHLLVVDEEAGELIVLRRRGAWLDAPSRVSVAATPVSVHVSADGTCCCSSLWPRRLTVVALAGSPRVLRSVPLAFAPRLGLPLGASARLVVADSFGGRLAVVDLSRGKVESLRTLPGHNIRGLALGAAGTLLVSQQLLNGLATTSRDDVHWGNLIGNNLLELSLARVLDPQADLLRDSRTHRLGDVGAGAADPAGVAVACGGQAVVALAGIGAVAIGPQPDGTWKRVRVGRRPTALTPSPDGRLVYVADTFADTVAVVDLQTAKVSAVVKLGADAELTPAERGELLFYDGRLSHDGWMSCHSCHTDGHSNGLLADTQGDGSYGTPKRVLSLLGVKDTGPWGWNGGFANLEAQVRQSVATTLRGADLSPDQVADLTAYLATLAPPPALRHLRGEADGRAGRRGRGVFARHRCGKCHAPPSYTSPRTYDVGLSDEAGARRFNPPSLRGVSQGGPFFHDGRAATLREVFTQHRHGLRGELDEHELTDLLHFLGEL